jgi:hypothetical protein
MALSSTQIAKIIIFLKEAAAQIDNARMVAKNAADHQTEASLAAFLRDIVTEIAHFEMLRQNAP